MNTIPLPRGLTVLDIETTQWVHKTLKLKTLIHYKILNLHLICWGFIGVNICSGSGVGQSLHGALYFGRVCLVVYHGSENTLAKIAHFPTYYTHHCHYRIAYEVNAINYILTSVHSCSSGVGPAVLMFRCIFLSQGWHNYKAEHSLYQDMFLHHQQIPLFPFPFRTRIVYYVCFPSIPSDI